MSNLIFDIETTGFHSIENRITCISLLVLETNDIVTFIDEDEKRILEDFWNAIDDNTTLIGYNSHSFDYPFIIRRSIINSVKIKKIKKHIDLMKEVNSFFVSYERNYRGSLDEWAFILTGEHKLENGSKCIEYFKNKQFDELRKHCENDVLITKLLLLRCRECNLI